MKRTRSKKSRDTVPLKVLCREVHRAQVIRGPTGQSQYCITGQGDAAGAFSVALAQGALKGFKTKLQGFCCCRSTHRSRGHTEACRGTHSSAVDRRGDPAGSSQYHLGPAGAFTEAHVKVGALTV
jgi:hypothetical protein